eukprot:RCo009398
MMSYSQEDEGRIYGRSSYPQYMLPTASSQARQTPSLRTSAEPSLSSLLTSRTSRELEPTPTSTRTTRRTASYHTQQYYDTDLLSRPTIRRTGLHTSSYLSNSSYSPYSSAVPLYPATPSVSSAVSSRFAAPPVSTAAYPSTTTSYIGSTSVPISATAATTGAPANPYDAYSVLPSTNGFPTTYSHLLSSPSVSSVSTAPHVRHAPALIQPCANARTLGCVQYVDAAVSTLCEDCLAAIAVQKQHDDSSSPAAAAGHRLGGNSIGRGERFGSSVVSQRPPSPSPRRSNLSSVMAGPISPARNRPAPDSAREPSGAAVGGSTGAPSYSWHSPALQPEHPQLPRLPLSSHSSSATTPTAPSPSYPASSSGTAAYLPSAAHATTATTTTTTTPSYSSRRLSSGSPS